MKTINCDVCKLAITTPVTGRNYFHLAHRDICEDCHDKLQFQIKPVVRTQMPFDYGWYDNLVKESIEKAVKKGKFDVK